MNARQYGDGAPVSLDDYGRAIAHAVAGDVARQVLDELQPGLGPMVIPEWTAALLREIGGRGGYMMQSPVYLSSPHVVMLHSTIRADGALYLALEVDGQHRVWEGVLRASGPAEPGCAT